MRYREWSETKRRQVRYAALAPAVIVLAAVSILFIRHADRTMVDAPTEAVAPANTAAAAPSTSGGEITVVDGLRRDEAVALIGDARRQAAAGNDAEAEALLAKVEKIVPRLPETQQARDDIARPRTPEGQLANHIRRARLAVDHDDSATAATELAAVARPKADAPEIAELRIAQQAAHDKKVHRETRIADALARMREAMARRDSPQQTAL